MTPRPARTSTPTSSRFRRRRSLTQISRCRQVENSLSFPSGGAPVTLPTNYNPPHVVVRVAIGDKTFNFLLDTSSPGITLDANVARQLGLINTTQTLLANARRTGVQAVVPEMRIGALDDAQRRRCARTGERESADRLTSRRSARVRFLSQRDRHVRCFEASRHRGAFGSVHGSRDDARFGYSSRARGRSSARAVRDDQWCGCRTHRARHRCRNGYDPLRVFRTAVSGDFREQGRDLARPDAL